MKHKWIKGDLWEVVEHSCCDGNSQDDINFVLKAVNNHDDLVRVLEGYISLVEDGDTLGPIECVGFLKPFRELLEQSR
jgi:hypothetical protein